MAEEPPLVLCMESAGGEDVALRIEPSDDFQCFLDKAKSLLGFDVDINSITKNQPVSLTDNCYQFLINAEQSLTDADLTNQSLDQILPPYKGNDDLVYILDDGTQIQASQINFDNDDPLVDLTVEKIPFVKYIEGETDDVDAENVEVRDTKLYSIAKSPVSKWSGNNSSPKCSFVSSLPFKPVSNRTSGFETQFIQYLEASASKSYATLNNVTNRSKSPLSLIRDNYIQYDDNFQARGNADDFSHYTREEVLNMFKDSPVAALPYENHGFTEKRKHARKSDPSRLYKAWNSKSVATGDLTGVLIAESQNQNCFICGKYVDNSLEKLYLFDNEDQRLHRSSPQRKMSTQLKIICEQCLEVNFKPCRMKSPNQSLNPDEYLVIRNNQQYIFQKTNSLNFKNISQGTVSNDANATAARVESDSKNRDKTVFVKVEIGSDGEIVTKPIDNDVGYDDVIIVKDETKGGSSSDVEIIENGPEIDDNIIDNLEDADEDVIEFLGKYQCDQDVSEMKCRFCERMFADVSEVIEHGETHRHAMEEGEVYPCPLCDYGYANFKWLKGHLKTAHDKTVIKAEAGDTKNTDEIQKVVEVKSSKESSPIAKRTRSAARKVVDTQPETPPKQEDSNNVITNPEAVNNDFVIKTEVKQECVGSSEDEIWIVRTADEEAGKQLQQILDAAKTENEDRCKKHKCDNCGQLFGSRAGLAAHACRRRGRKRKPQADTAMRVPTREDFIKRARGRPRIDEFGCNDLLTVIPRKKKNRSPTSDPHIVTCHYCNESFTSKVRLKFHMQFHEPTSLVTAGGEYACSECARGVFATETELFDHVHFQHKHKRWQCPVDGCGKTFYLRATLTKHSRTHTDTRRYACSTCGKRFLDKQTLDEHGVTHLQKKPFQCHICLKQLTRRSRLRMHLRAHEEELCPRLVLVCAVCARAFRDAADVQEHLTRSPECIAAFADELKEETEAVTVQLSPTSGVVRHTVQVTESPKLSKPIRRQVGGPLAEGLLASVPDAARAITRVVQIEKAFRCEFCEDVFYSEDGINNHRVIHKGIKNPFTCHICKVSFASYSRCTTHKTTHGFYKRSLAEAKKQASRSPGSRHEAGPSSTGILGYGDFPVVKHFLCEDCGRSYLHWTYLQVHRRMKHAVDSYQHKCDQCQLTLPNSWSLTYHKKKMHSNTPKDDILTTSKPGKDDYRIPCRDCDQLLPNKSALYKHRKKEHSDKSLNMNNKPAPPGVFRCGACDKQCGSRGGLDAHSRGHAARSAACAKCGHSFPSAADLHKHLKEVHGHELDYPCSVCTKLFCSRAELAVHARTHGAARAHACPVCGHGFRTASMRNEHLRIHTGERPYPCDLCGIAFRRSTAMRNHRLIHTGERAFPCARCPKRFRVRSDLRAHLRRKHPARLVLIEVAGLNPSPEEVMGHLTLNNIPHDKVIEITKMSFPKGTSSVVPSSSRALSLLCAVPRTQLAYSHARPEQSCIYDLVPPARRGRGIAKNPRKCKVLPSADQTAPSDPNAFPGHFPASGEELPDLNMQLLLRDGGQVVDHAARPPQ